MGKEDVKPTPVEETAEFAEIDEESYAVLLAAVSDACRLPISSFQITSIKEL